MANRALIRTISLTLGRQGLAAVVQFLNVLIIAKYLGPEGNGLYSMSLIVTLTIALLLNLGLGQANAYFIGREEFSEIEVTHVSIVLFLFYLLVFLMLALLLGERLAVFLGMPQAYCWVLALCVPIVVLNSWLLGVFQGKQRFSIFNLAMVIPSFVSLTVTLLVVTVGIDDSLYYFLGWFMGNLISTVYLLSLVSISGAEVARAWNSPYLLNAVKYGWKVHLSNLCSFGVYRVDVYILGFFYGSAAVGVYSLAQQIVERFWMIAQAVSTVLFPRLASLRDINDRGERVTLTVYACKWVFFASLVLGTVALILVDYFVGELFGAEYSEAVTVVRILLPGMVLFNVSRVFASYISSSGFVGYMACISFLSLVISLVLNSMLIPSFGLLGGATATSTTYGISFLLGLLVFIRVAR